jgi:hypothetical protein
MHPAVSRALMVRRLQVVAAKEMVRRRPQVAAAEEMVRGLLSFSSKLLCGKMGDVASRETGKLGPTI